MGPRQSKDVRGRGKKREAASSLAFFPASHLPPISALSSAPSVTSVVTPVILTLAQQACYPRSADFVLKLGVWEAAFSSKCGSGLLSPGSPYPVTMTSSHAKPFWAEMIVEQKIPV